MDDMDNSVYIFERPFGRFDYGPFGSIPFNFGLQINVPERSVLSDMVGTTTTTTCVISNQ